jgi:hypothetical protein
MRRVVMMTVFEALGRDKAPKFGAHVIAHMLDAAQCERLIESINSSVAYGTRVLARRVEQWSGLTTYLLKEATQQARYRRQFRTIGGSIPLGVLGGDRVILSNDLRDTLLNTGRIKPYQRSYAKRAAKGTRLQAGEESVKENPCGPMANVIVGDFCLTRSTDEAPKTAMAA